MVRLQQLAVASAVGCLNPIKPLSRWLPRAKCLIGVLALAAGLALPASAQQRSVINPGFEQPTVTGTAGFNQIANGLVPGWEADPDPTIEIWRNGGSVVGSILAYEGVQFAEMNSTRPGALYQLVCFTNGETLRWSFAHRARNGGADPQIANYEIASATSSTTIIQTLTSQSTAIGAGWRVNSNSVGVPFTGTTGVYRLQFRTTNPGSVGNFLDDVQIQLVPYLEFNATSTSDLESAGTGGALPRIVIDGNVSTPLTLNLTVTGGTATLGTDYTTPTGTSTFTVTIPVGNYDSASFATGITIVNDAVIEPDETITFSISGSSTYQLASATTCGAPANTTMRHTIRDEDTAPAIDVVKTGTFNDTNADGRPQAGETIRYAFRVTNTGNVPLAAITLSDDLAGVTISGGSIASLGVGLTNSTAFTGTYTLTQADINAGGVTNLARVRGSGNNGFGGPDIVVTDTSTVTTTLSQASAISLVKGVPTGTRSLGATLTYTVTATNSGNVTLTNVVVSDPLLTPPSATCASVSPEGTCVLTGTYVVTQADVAAGTIVNTASVTGNPPTGATVTETSAVTTPITLPTFTCDSTFYEVISGQLSRLNPVTGTYVPIGPKQLDYNGIGFNPVDNYIYGTVQSGVAGSRLIRIGSDGAIQPVLMTWTGASNNNGVMHPSNNTLYSLVSTTRLQRTNVQTGAVSTITISPSVPNLADLAYVSGNVVGLNGTTLYIVDTTTGASRSVTIPGIPAGGYGAGWNTFDGNVFLSSNSTGQIHEIASALTTPTLVSVTNAAISSNHDGANCIFAGSPLLTPRLELTKSFAGFTDANASGTRDLGDTLRYSYSVRNTGAIAVQAITVSDPTATIVGGPIASLLAGDSDTTTFTATHVVTQADVDAGGYQNTATVSGNAPNGTPVNDISDAGTDATGAAIGSPETTETPDLAGNIDGNATNDPTLITLARAPALTLVKDAPIGTAVLGGTLSYTITATNTGNLTLSTVVVSDPLLTPSSRTCATVAPGGTCVLTGTHVVTVAESDAGRVVNTASVTGNPPSGPAVTGTSSVTTPVTQTPGISLAKGAPTGTVAVGSTLTYAVTATNTGNVTLTTVEVSDPLLSPTTVTCTSVAPQGACVLSGTYVVTLADADAGQIVNTAGVTGNPPTGGPVTGSASQTTTVPQTPGISLVKDAPSGVLSLGGTLTYTVTATNTGNVTLTGVTVTDTLITPGTTTCTSVAPLGTCVLTGTYVVTQDDVDAGEIVNTADVTGNPPTGVPVTGTATVTTTLPQNPGLGLVKNAPTGTLALGQTLSYTITATNTGDVTLTGVVVEDPLLAPDTATCATVLIGETCVLTGTYVVTQGDLDAGEIVNTATATGDTPNGTPLTSTSTVTTALPQNPAIDLVKDAPTGIPALGETLTYTITATNTGDVTLTGVVVSDPLLASASRTCATLAPAATCVLTGTHVVTLAESDAGEIVNTATVTAQPPAGGPEIGTSTVTTVITQNPAIDLVKDAPIGTLAAGETLTYAVTATNSGNVTLRDVVVTDAMLSPGSATCPSVAPTETCVLTGTYVVTQEDMDRGDLVNTADVTSTPPVGGPITATGTVTTVLPQNPRLGVVKTGTFNDLNGDSLAQVGETITYAFTVENTGNITITGITLADSLPGIDLSGGPIAILAPGEIDTDTFTATYTLTDANDVEGQVRNQATATGTDPNGGEISDDSDGSSPAEGQDDPTITPFSRELGPRTIKTVSPDTAVIGDTVRFTITFRNSTSTSYPGSSFIDELPPGMAYVPGSATIDDVAAEPEIDGRRLIWAGRDLGFNTTFKVDLAVRVVAGAGAGTLTNRALVRDASGAVVTNIATATVQLRPEAVFDCTDVIGKVFLDRNGNGIQDPDDPRAALTVDAPYDSKFGAAPVVEDEPTLEPGIAGVRVVTVNGLRITTDEFGRFSVPCAALPKAEGSNFTLKLDPRTLPEGLMVSSENPRTMRLTAGKIAKMNFAVRDGARVNISLTASAFEAGSNRPGGPLRDALGGLVSEIRATPTILRLVYLLGPQEQEATATARLRQVERVLRQIWMIRGTYPLAIDKSVQRPE